MSPFIATPGRFTSDPNGGSYTITGSSNWPNGLEAINWIKVSITLSGRLKENHKKGDNPNNRIAFSVEFDGVYFSPDFTWYFAPPRGYIVGQESKVAFNGKDFPNTLQSVSDYTTVEFKQWVKRPESILERKKTRMLFPDENKNEQLQPITVSLQLENPHQHDNLQFFTGLLVAFLLAFCSDKTRVNDYYSCLHGICSCADNKCKCLSVVNSLTIVTPFLLLLMFLVVVMWPGRALSKNAKGRQKGINCLFYGCVYLALLALGVLVIYVYFLWLIFPDFMKSIGITCHWNKGLILGSYICTGLPSLAYLVYCVCYLKCKISDYM